MLKFYHVTKQFNNQMTVAYFVLREALNKKTLTTTQSANGMH